MPTKPSHVAPVVESLTPTDKLLYAGKVVRALAKLDESTQRNVLAVVADEAELSEALYKMLGILRHLTPEDRAAVVSSARTLVRLAVVEP